MKSSTQSFVERLLVIRSLSIPHAMIRAVALLIAGGLFLALSALGPQVTYGILGSVRTGQAMTLRPSANACGGESAPPQAVAAGFTTCVANFDWTTRTGASWVPYSFGGTVSNLSNWLDLNNTNAALPWHCDEIFNPSPTCPSAGAVSQTTDPRYPTASPYGGTVLDLHWNSAWNGLYTGSGQSNTSISTALNGKTAPLAFANGYYEAVYRDDINTCPATDCGPDGFWTYGYGDRTPNRGIVIAELYGGAGGYGDASGQGGFTWVSYRKGIPGKANLPAGWSSVTYHKYGGLLTTSAGGGDSTHFCSWVDNVFQSCGKHAFGGGLYPMALIAWAGALAGTDRDVPTHNIYAMYWRIWTCAGFGSVNLEGASPAPNSCAGTALSQSTLNNASLSYWHN